MIRIDLSTDGGKSRTQCSGLGQNRLGIDIERGQFHRAADITGLGSRSFCKVISRSVADTSRLVQQSFADRRQHISGLAVLEQREAQTALQRRAAMRGNGLADIQRLPRIQRAAGFGNGEEKTQIRQSNMGSFCTFAERMRDIVYHFNLKLMLRHRYRRNLLSLVQRTKLMKTLFRPYHPRRSVHQRHRPTRHRAGRHGQWRVRDDQLCRSQSCQPGQTAMRWIALCGSSGFFPPLPRNSKPGLQNQQLRF